MKKIVLIGCGEIYKRFLQVFDDTKYSIVAVCDNDSSKKGKIIEGYQISHIDILMAIEFDFICITCNAFKEISKQLRNKGVNAESILDFSFLKDYELISQDNNCNDMILSPYKLVNKGDVQGHIYAERMRDIHMILSSKILAREYKGKCIDSLADVEFRCFSQNGEDGIIQWIIENTNIKNKIFIEFGVEDYKESNTRFLLMNNNWSGLVMDGSEENVKKIIKWSDYWRYDLVAKSMFVTKENINDSISEEGIKGEIGLLSVDIDGNDYWVLDSITCIAPVILICEYNSVWGDKHAVSTPYQPNFYRTDKHYSNLYYGASLQAFVNWANEKDYVFLGCNTIGNNAFFVKREYFNCELLKKEPVFINTKVRESRDKNGNLSYLKYDERLEIIKELEVVNLESNTVEKIKELYHL